VKEREKGRERERERESGDDGVKGKRGKKREPVGPQEEGLGRQYNQEYVPG
jgi:hypothetical protein